jgi:hypothetical protein
MKQRMVSAFGISAAAAAMIIAGGTPAHGADTVAKPSLPSPVSTVDLADMSGGASPSGVAITNQTLTALNAGNTVNANSLVTGDVTLQPGAFNGFNGIGNFVFNTGNNNNLQGTLSVTIITPQ